MYFNFSNLLEENRSVTYLLQESKPFTSSDARSHDLEANFTISQ
jgi:hypothetical protein